ncbi:MAG: 4Fe-4S dicluster domain-containing protein [Thermoplasmata archaeon]|nr:4Fe-4S dicluster domain-containing protein [Thermoplasmata archaeon]
MVTVDVQHAKCTGCTHCRDVCPVTVFEMNPRETFGDIVDDTSVAAKFQFRAEKSKVIAGADCIMCEACLFECEGECITIVDDEGKVHQSTYK